MIDSPPRKSKKKPRQRKDETCVECFATVKAKNMCDHFKAMHKPILVKSNVVMTSKYIREFIDEKKKSSIQQEQPSSVAGHALVQNSVLVERPATARSRNLGNRQFFVSRFDDVFLGIKGIDFQSSIYNLVGYMRKTGNCSPNAAATKELLNFATSQHNIVVFIKHVHDEKCMKGM